MRAGGCGIRGRDTEREILERQIPPPLAANVKPEVLTRYKRIRTSKGGGPAVVALSGEGCSGCHMRVPPKTVNEILGGSILLSCNYCGRMLLITPKCSASTARNRDSLARICSTSNSTASSSDWTTSDPCSKPLTAGTQYPAAHRGTNGKGSVVAIVAAIARAAGYRVGRFTSPHLLDVTERFLVDGAPMSDAALDEHIAFFRAVAEQIVAAAHVLRDETPPSRSAGLPNRRSISRSSKLNGEAGLDECPRSRGYGEHVEHRARPHEIPRGHAGADRVREGGHHQTGRFAGPDKRRRPRATIRNRAEELGSPVIESGQDFRF